MSDPFFFGYGSLVNAATHSYPEPQTATLTGWRRAWRHTGLRDVAFLTAIPDSRSQIEGMIAPVPDADWAALDKREWAYERVPVQRCVTHTLNAETQIALYIVPKVRQAAPSARHPILLSYLDVVVQGYLRVFGPEGANRFFETTDGWDAPVLNDREAPRYPRHQALTSDERTFVDDALTRLSAVIQHLE